MVSGVVVLVYSLLVRFVISLLLLFLFPLNWIWGYGGSNGFTLPLLSRRRSLTIYTVLFGFPHQCTLFTYTPQLNLHWFTWCRQRWAKRKGLRKIKNAFRTGFCTNVSNPEKILNVWHDFVLIGRRAHKITSVFFPRHESTIADNEKWMLIAGWWWRFSHTLQLVCIKWIALKCVFSIAETKNNKEKIHSFFSARTNKLKWNEKKIGSTQLQTRTHKVSSHFQWKSKIGLIVSSPSPYWVFASELFP